MLKNVISNVIARIWGFISIYLFLPIFLKYLGPEGFGLVSFYTTLLGVIVIVDFGFSSTINRNFTIYLNTNKLKIGDLIKTFEFFFFCIIFIIIFICIYYVKDITNNVLSFSFYAPTEVNQFLYIMFLSVGFQLFAGLYISAFMGAQKQVLANSVQISWGFLRVIGSFIILKFYNAGVKDFLLWQLVCNIIYFLSIRFLLYKYIRTALNVRVFNFDFKIIKNTFKYFFGVASISLISIVLSQFDKIVISKSFNIDILGYYNLAYSFAMIPIIILSPIGIAVFPKFTQLIADGSEHVIKKFYINVFEISCIILIPILAYILFNIKLILSFWLSDNVIEREIFFPVVFLILGQFLQALTLIPYYFILSKGKTKFNVYIGLFTSVLYIPMCLYFTFMYGVSGTAFSWLFVNILIFPIYYIVFYKYVLKHDFKFIFLNCILKSIVLSFIFVLLTNHFTHSSSDIAHVLFFNIIFYFFSVISLVAFSNDVKRNVILLYLRYFKNAS